MPVWRTSSMRASRSAMSCSRLIPVRRHAEAPLVNASGQVVESRCECRLRGARALAPVAAQIGLRGCLSPQARVRRARHKESGQIATACSRPSRHPGPLGSLRAASRSWLLPRSKASTSSRKAGKILRRRPAKALENRLKEAAEQREIPAPGRRAATAARGQEKPAW